MPPAWTPPVAGPVPERGTRLGARAIDLLIAGAMAMPLVLVTNVGHRPFTFLALLWVAMVAYETALVATTGATLGKLAVGLRVVPLDSTARPSAQAAFRRAAVTSALTLVPLVGWGILVFGTLADALTRGMADRAADTMVVPKRTALPIRHRDLPGYADFARPPRLSPVGRVGDLDVRARARLRRLHGVPLLVVLVAVLNVATFLPWSGLTVFVVGTAVWLVAFVVDETVRVARTGATPGHELAGLVVHSPARGGPPSLGRSFARALVFGLSAYTGVGLVLLGVSALLIRSSDTGRSLHDLAGGTWVVADPRLSPEVQRQRAMRMRLGEVA